VKGKENGPTQGEVRGRNFKLKTGPNMRYAKKGTSRLSDEEIKARNILKGKGKKTPITGKDDQKK